MSISSNDLFTFTMKLAKFELQAGDANSMKQEVKMFDTMKTAKRIKDARIAKDMTQMALADAMEVSFQAVSNWERGNSMPDISKLKQLCSVLEISLEYLLGEEDENITKTVKELTEDKVEDISIENISKIASIVPPKAIKVMVYGKSCDASDLAALAPFLDDEDLNEIAKSIAKVRISDLVPLAPFLADEILDSLVMRYVEENKDSFKLSEIKGLMPFLDSSTIKKLAILYMDRK